METGDINYQNGIPDWHKDARCREEFSDSPSQASEIFFGPENDKSKHETYEKRIMRLEKAKLICSRCPVVEECKSQLVEVELKNKAITGIWGGYHVFNHRENNKGDYGPFERKVLSIEESIEFHRGKLNSLNKRKKTVA